MSGFQPKAKAVFEILPKEFKDSIRSQKIDTGKPRRLKDRFINNG